MKMIETMLFMQYISKPIKMLDNVKSEVDSER